MVVLGGGAVSYERGTPVAFRCSKGGLIEGHTARKEHVAAMMKAHNTTWFRVGGQGFHVSCLGFRVSCLGFRVWGSGFRVSCFVSKVLGLEFRVPGSGFGVEG